MTYEKKRIVTIDRELFKRQARRGFDRRKWRGNGVCNSLILLANCTAGNEVVNEDGKSRPPKVTLNDSFGAKTSKMAREGRGMERVEERGASRRRYVHSTLVV